MTQLRLKTSKDLERYLTLVHLLATDGTPTVKLLKMRALAKAWGVDTSGGYIELTARMARHVMEYRGDSEDG